MAAHTLNKMDLTSTLLAGLLDLEQSGDLVITHPAPQALADKLCEKILSKWAMEHLDEPIEAVIDWTMRSSANSLSEIFNLGSSEASSAVEAFVRKLGEERTSKEVAELLAHQGKEEIALGAFFCAVLQGGEYYSSDYLDWRIAHNAKQKAGA